MTRLQRERFDAIYEQITDELPEFVRKLAREVTVLVEDEPSPEVREALGLPSQGQGRSDLCGAQFSDPSRIYLFRGPLLRLSGRRRAELKLQIRITLLHELAHHLGWSEEDLERIGYS